MPTDRPRYPDGSVVMDGHVTAEYVAELSARIAELEAEVARLRAPFDRCDDQDWRRLWHLLGGGAYGRFWADTLKEVHAALSAPDTGGAADGE